MFSIMTRDDLGDTGLYMQSVHPMQSMVSVRQVHPHAKTVECHVRLQASQEPACQEISEVPNKNQTPADPTSLSLKMQVQLGDIKTMELASPSPIGSISLQRGLPQRHQGACEISNPIFRF